MPETRLLAEGIEGISYWPLRWKLRRKAGEKFLVAIYKWGAKRSVGVKVIVHQSDIRTVQHNSAGDDPRFVDVIWCASTVAKLEDPKAVHDIHTS